MDKRDLGVSRIPLEEEVMAWLCRFYEAFRWQYTSLHALLRRSNPSKVLGPSTNVIHSIHFAQIIGFPMYFYNREWYYAWMAMTKKYFAITTTVMTQIWGPTTIRISGDASVAGQIQQDKFGIVTFKFPHRLILIANHQVCPVTSVQCWKTANMDRFILIGCIFGGSAISTHHQCMGTSSSSSRSLSSIYQSLAGV